MAYGGSQAQRTTPHQSRRLTLFHNRLKEATKDLHPIARANAGQARMVGKWLVQVIAKVPPHAEPISRMAHQLPFGTNALEEHDQLQLEKDDWINQRTTAA